MRRRGVAKNGKTGYHRRQKEKREDEPWQTVGRNWKSAVRTAASARCAKRGRMWSSATAAARRRSCSSARPRRARGRAGRALCRQRRAAARRYARHHRSRPHDGLHREHRQVPPAAEPRSARRGAGRLHRLSARAGDAAAPEADRLPRPHRGDAPDPRGLQDHARAWAVGEKGRL